jgi:putative ABC transport system substrate-binding protein
MSILLRRRDFIARLGGAAAWPLTTRAQQPRLPMVGFISGASPEMSGGRGDAFRRGLAERGYVEGQNVTVDYHWLGGQNDQLRPLMSDLVRRNAAVIATPGSEPASLAAKAATATIPIVFGIGGDPVKIGLVTSIPRPGGNATGMSFLAQEIGTKQLGLLRELMPRAMRIAVLVNPANPTVVEVPLRELLEAARILGVQIQVLKASTGREIEAAFAELAHERADALFISPDALFSSRTAQIATLAARHVAAVERLFAA